MRNLLLLSFLLLSFNNLKAQWITNDVYHQQDCSDWACIGICYVSIDYNLLPATPGSGSGAISFNIPAISGGTNYFLAYGPFHPYVTQNGDCKLWLSLSQSKVRLELDGIEINHNHIQIPIEVPSFTTVSMYGTSQPGFYHVLLMFSNLPNQSY